MATNILIVEDDDIMGKVTQNYFIKKGYHVDLAIDGQKAMEMLQNNSYQLVVTDLNMPYVNGQQLIEAIKRNNYGKIKIIVMTTMGTEAMIAEIFALGADDFITKPFKASELLARAQKLVF